MGAKEILIPIFVVPLGLFAIYQIWQWHVNHLFEIESLRLTTLRDRGAQVHAQAAQDAAHERDIEAALEEVEEPSEALEDVLAGAGGRGTRDRGVGSGGPLPPV